MCDKQTSDLDRINCYGILVHEKLKNGILGSFSSISFQHNMNGNTVNISISQAGIRQLEIRSQHILPFMHFWDVFDSIDMFMMLCEGHFVPVCDVIAFCEEKDISLPEIVHQRVNLYKSADFLMSNNHLFLHFTQCLNEQMFAKWNNLLQKLGILNDMVLYSLANTGIPCEIACAFLIESNKALCELVNEYRPDIISKTDLKGHSSLKERLKLMIYFFGQEIFQKELSVNEDAFLDVLRNTRNRIGHLRTMQGERVLSAKECVLYLIKLSYLYRHTLLELLGVRFELYKHPLIKAVEKWDNWGSILDNFLKKL